MMTWIQVPLQQEPNQQLSFYANSLVIDVRIITRGEQVYMDVAVDETDVQTCVRCLPNLPIVDYMPWKLGGNLVFVQVGDSGNPFSYEYFNTDWELWYYYG